MDTAPAGQPSSDQTGTAAITPASEPDNSDQPTAAGVSTASAVQDSSGVATASDAPAPQPEVAEASESNEAGKQQPSAGESSADPSAEPKVMADQDEESIASSNTDGGDTSPPSPAATPAPGGLSGLAALAGGNPAGKSAAPVGVAGASPAEWNTLLEQCSQQFYAMVAPSGRQVVVSTAPDEYAVLSTVSLLPDLSGALRTTGNAARDNQLPQILLSGKLSSLLNSVAFTNDDALVLLGTTDGQLLVRTAPPEEAVDLFAADLIQFRDEHRPIAQLSDKAIVAIRPISDETVLTIDASGSCAIWKIEDLVLPVTPVAAMSSAQVEEAAAIHRPTPQHQIALSSPAVVDVKFSSDNQYAAILHADYSLWIVQLAEGRIAARLSPGHFAKAAPTCVTFADDNQLLAALTNGQLIRFSVASAAAQPAAESLSPTAGLAGANAAALALRGLTGAAPDENTDEETSAFYEILYRPAAGAREKAVTAILLGTDPDSVFCGRQDGTVSQVSLTSQRILQTERWHTGAVIAFQPTAAGRFSLCTSRSLALRTPPGTAANVAAATSVRKVVLPRDPALTNNRRLSDAANQTPSLERRLPSDVRPTTMTKVQATDVVIRPADNVLALLQHQLRISETEGDRTRLRQDVLKHQGLASRIPLAGNSPADADSDAAAVPLLRGEITSEFDYAAGTFRRPLLTISQDGLTVAASQQTGLLSAVASVQTTSRLSAWDVMTGTTLRSWSLPLGGQTLQQCGHDGNLVLSPFRGQFELSHGTILSDPMHATSLASVSPSGQSLAVGLVP
ncbi:MAG: hypothetical protein KDA96_23820, partial [Planctomycetaceae bacterium]|nr:hypothetical protein [Planctomycetaceae bacterium]